jgi:EmrB/QacA subfamily drug resistance transporter
MAFIDSTVVNVALPALQSSLHATVVDVQWVVEAYGLFLSALILAGGALGDLYGRRKVFLGGVMLFAIASVACGLAATMRQLTIARSVQGVGAAFLVPGSLAIISASFDVKSRGRAIGTWSGFTAITTAFGPVLGGWLIQHASWRWVFFINLPLAAAVILAALARVPESRSASIKHIDWLGAVLATVSLAGLVEGLLESSRLGWRHPLVFGSLAVGLASLISFLLAEARVSSPMVPLSLFRSRAFSGANLLTLFLYSAIGVFFFFLPMNLIQVQGYSTTAAGAAALPMIFLMFVLSRWSGGLVERYGARKPLIIGPLIAASGFILFALHSTGASYWKSFFLPFVVLGFGMAVTVAPLTTLVMNAVDQDRSGTASGINNAVARVAGVLAIAVLGIVMVVAFTSRLQGNLANLQISPHALQELKTNAIRGAAMDMPAGLSPEQSSAVRRTVSDAFLFGFRLIMYLCALLAITSSVMAGAMIPGAPPRAKPSLASAQSAA